MELRQLKHFVVLAEELHFGRAARRLHMTQPPLSLSIGQLEARLGFKLFTRDSKRVALTPAGSAFLVKARELLLHLEQTHEFGQMLASGRAGQLEIGFSSATLLYRGLASILADFTAANPDVHLALREASSQDQCDLVRAGRLDAGFVNFSSPPPGLEGMVMMEEHFMACLPASHPVLKNLGARAGIAIEALRDEDFVLISEKAARAYRNHVIALCDAAGFQPRVTLDVVSLLSVVALVAHGMGVSIVPESMSRAGIPGARFVRIRGSQLQPSVHMVWNRERQPTGLTALIDTVQQSVKARRAPRRPA